MVAFPFTNHAEEIRSHKCYMAVEVMTNVGSHIDHLPFLIYSGVKKAIVPD